ncbi:TIR domain-containing protein [Parasphingorhabdus sp. DH2-15]|uniref:TIR domain-containing protein n=1 Tax=Parasphingorhabdus sp. DH2-15 TaxID=3444112 RepID=UPI003F686675
MKPTIFIGSTSEHEEVARALELNLEGKAEVNIWAHSFRPGRTVFDELVSFSQTYDFAILITTPLDAVTSRDVEQLAPRDNVVFELGLFLGALGRDRVFAVTEFNKPSKIMSDYSGVTYLTYDGHRSDNDLTKALSPVSTQLMMQIGKVGKRNDNPLPSVNEFSGELIGLERIYDSFNLARDDIYSDLKSTKGPIRIFIHIASQDIGISGSFFDVLDEVAKSGNVDMRVLHASINSPLFRKERLISIGKDFRRVMHSLEYATNSLKSLEEAKNSSLRRRSHDFPFVWRLYFVFDRLYLMPYFSDKDAVRHSPVLVFGRSKNSLYHVFKEWFDHAWTTSSPERVSLDDVVSPATPAGAALFLKWQGKHVFGIPKRDFEANPNRLRFYGIGGKRNSGSESFEQCAIREANEELSGALASLESADSTDFVSYDGTTRRVSIYNSETVPALIMEKADHSGLGLMSVDADNYILVAYNGVLRQEPKPSRELAAVILVPDECLNRFHDVPVLTLAEVLSLGGEISAQDGIKIEEETLLVPHGTATYAIRKLVGD